MLCVGRKIGALSAAWLILCDRGNESKDFGEVCEIFLLCYHKAMALSSSFANYCCVGVLILFSNYALKNV